MSISIYNTLARAKQELKPRQAGQLGIYVCGMTVYDYCHLGHARVLLAFDVIVRWLRERGLDVTYIRNITDIDDKILRRAAENGEDYRDLVARFIDAMHEDERALGITPPNKEPRATQHIDDMIAMIERLIASDHAYAADNGDVYYRVSAFADYGKLSGRKPEELLAGARIAVDEAKSDPRDFALWKAAKPGEVSWPSPWGDGRPGWHIECSAMSTCCLGNNFDIHGGGPDLVFPHHENEIAQAEAATGEDYANCWMHAGAVRVDNEKMSKSLGNFFTIREILEQWHPEVVRYFLISSHYRSAINYSTDNLSIAQQSLDRFYQCLQSVPKQQPVSLSDLPDSEALTRFCKAMDDDFNTPEALAVLFELVRDINQAQPDQAESLAQSLVSMGAVLGILQLEPRAYLQYGGDEVDADWVEAQIEARLQARKDKDFAKADAIREALSEAGIVLEDSREGTQWRRA